MSSTEVESRTPTTNGPDLKGVHPSAVGANTQPDATKTKPEDESQTNKESVDADHLNSEYPEQKHAGAVGYGPNYHAKPGFLDKITGMKEQVQGKVTHNPELATKGHDRITGDLKKKELDADAKADPFADPEQKKQEEGEAPVENKSHEQGNRPPVEPGSKPTTSVA
ncbi:calmodulin-like protein [Favolaschia claudopus]|uniref:Calmodulin-like protein n=1 Tax=Favolaschia claudopus TaxID=2862362 RepID=A0AAW0DGB2_9AGAR